MGSNWIYQPKKRWTVREAAQAWGATIARVHQWIQVKRIKGAVKDPFHPSEWVIPRGAVCPRRAAGSAGWMNPEKVYKGIRAGRRKKKRGA